MALALGHQKTGQEGNCYLYYRDKVKSHEDRACILLALTEGWLGLPSCAQALLGTHPGALWAWVNKACQASVA